MNLTNTASGTDIVTAAIANSIVDIKLYHGWRVGGQIIATTCAINTAADVTSEMAVRTERFLFSAICMFPGFTSVMNPRVVSGVVTAIISTPEVSGNIITVGATLSNVWTLDVATPNTLKVIITPTTNLSFTLKVDWHMVLHGIGDIGQYGIRP